MFIDGAICSYEPEAVTQLYTSTLSADFERLRHAGLRHVLAYGEPLRDADNSCVVKAFTYYAQLPSGSLMSALSTATCGLIKQFELNGRNSFKTNQMNGDQGFHFAFAHQGREIDLIVLSSLIPCAERVARGAQYGLSGISMDERGFGFASENYLNDKSLKTLTINRDIPKAERQYAREQAEALKARPAYRNFKIIG